MSLNPVQKADLEEVLRRTLLHRRPAVIRAWLDDKSPVNDTDRQALRRWKRQEFRSTPRQLERLAEGLGISSAWFRQETA